MHLLYKKKNGFYSTTLIQCVCPHDFLSFETFQSIHFLKNMYHNKLNNCGFRKHLHSYLRHWVFFKWHLLQHGQDCNNSSKHFWGLQPALHWPASTLVLDLFSGCRTSLGGSVPHAGEPWSLTAQRMM
jgi:hypothetical protein